LYSSPDIRVTNLRTMRRAELVALRCGRRVKSFNRATSWIKVVSVALQPSYPQDRVGLDTTVTNNKKHNASTGNRTPNIRSVAKRFAELYRLCE
jgi:hypothetical protein